MKYLNGMYGSEADDFGDGWFLNVFPKFSKHGNVLREKNRACNIKGTMDRGLKKENSLYHCEWDI